ncbi:MAG: lysostaphin resistance A-like protein [Bacteroidales bacterium]
MRKNILSNICLLIIPIYLISALTIGKLSEICSFFGADEAFTSSLKLLLSSPLTWLIAYSIIKKENQNFKYSFKFGEPANIPLIILAAIGFQYGIISPVVSLIPISESIVSIVEKAFLIIPLSSIMLSVIIISPVFEELIYRGIILDTLLKKRKRWTAIFIAAFIYGFIHLNPYQFCSVFLLSLFIGWIYSYTKSISICVLIHCVVNTSEAIISFIKSPEGMAKDLITTSIDWSSRITLFFTVIALVIAVFAIYELQDYFKKKELQNKLT